jgi:hypothetical protein
MERSGILLTLKPPPANAKIRSLLYSPSGYGTTDGISAERGPANFGTPHPPLRGTLSRRERGCFSDGYFSQREKAGAAGKREAGGDDGFGRLIMLSLPNSTPTSRSFSEGN